MGEESEWNPGERESERVRVMSTGGSERGIRGEREEYERGERQVYGRRECEEYGRRVIERIMREIRLWKIFGW